MRLMIALALLLGLIGQASAEWAEFAASPEFQELSPEDRNQARIQYFEERIADRVPEGREEEYLSAFMRDTQPDVAPQIGYQQLRTDPEVVAAEEATKREVAECVLEHMKGVQSDIAARAIFGACRATAGAE